MAASYFLCVLQLLIRSSSHVPLPPPLPLAPPPPSPRTYVRPHDRTTTQQGCGSIYISFEFDGGIQGPNHYQPGKRYSSDSRGAYLPNNKEGRLVLRLFHKGKPKPT